MTVLTLITFLSCVSLGIADVLLIALGMPTVSQHVWDALDRAPVIIGFMFVAAIILTFALRREGTKQGVRGWVLTVCLVWLIMGHFCWRG